MIEAIKRWWAGKPECRHRWTIMIEKYPTFTKDYWQCSECQKFKVFENSKPPVKVKLEMCSLGHLHSVSDAAQPHEQDWPEVIG